MSSCSSNPVPLVETAYLIDKIGFRRFNAGLPELSQSVKTQGLESLWQSTAILLTSPASDPAPGRRCASTKAKSRRRRLHIECPQLRCDHLRLLRGRQALVRRAHSQRVHTFFAGEIVPAFQGVGGGKVPVRESTGTEGWPVGRRADGREDERLPVAEAGARGPVRGVDGRRSSEAFQVRCAQGGSGRERCPEGILKPNRTAKRAEPGVRFAFTGE